MHSSAHKIFALCLVLLAALGSTWGYAAEPTNPSVKDFLQAIRQVESGDRYDCPSGRAGEQGPYQFRRKVWHQHTDADFSLARSRFADEVAVSHYDWLAERLRRNNTEVSVWNLAAAWNAGVSAVISQKVPRSARDYAQRVANLTRESAELRHRLTPVILISVL